MKHYSNVHGACCIDTPDYIWYPCPKCKRNELNFDYTNNIIKCEWCDFEVEILYSDSFKYKKMLFINKIKKMLRIKLNPGPIKYFVCYE